jgi:hypothetical protein
MALRPGAAPSLRLENPDPGGQPPGFLIRAGIFVAGRLMESSRCMLTRESPRSVAISAGSPGGEDCRRQRTVNMSLAKAHKLIVLDQHIEKYC